MKKLTVVAVVCLLIFGATGIAMASNGVPLSRAKIIDDIVQGLSLNKSHGSITMATGNGTGCVDVDIELPDTVTVDDYYTPVFAADGSFEIINCGDEAGEVMLGFSASINVGGFLDTVIYFSDYPITLAAGENLSEEFSFPVPPFSGTYTICLYASSGDVADTACATMTVVAAEMPGIPIDVCGVLVQGDNCVLFAPGCNNSDAFTLSDYGSFVVDDTVHVVGDLDFDCQTECVGAIGCITNTVIEQCGGWQPEYPFDGCGVLVQGTDCVLFEALNPMDSAGPQSADFVLDDYGDFVVGDTVFVHGLLKPNCETTCSDADGCIVENSIEACQHNPEYPFEAIGTITQGTDCILFTPRDLGESFVLDNYGNAVVGDTVYVAGTLDIECETTCSDADGCILDNYIEVIDFPGGGGGNPNMPFAGVGVIVQGSNCVLLAEEMTGDLLYLDNYGDYTIGDTVCVVGFLDVECDIDCPDAIGCVEVQHIENCGGGTIPDSTYYFNGPGVLVQGTDCVLFVPANCASDAYFALDDYGTFVVGDTVCVEGVVTMNCETQCSDAVGCIAVTNIADCGSGPQGEYIEVPGFLTQGIDCVLFAPEGMPPVGGFVLDEYGTFVVGDHVLVKGYLDLNCQTDCSQAQGCITDNTIEAAVDSSQTNLGLDDANNYPNPFNPATTISFNLSKQANVTLTIHNILGQTIATLIDNKTLVGPQTVRWDGTDSNHETVASGIYFYRIVAGESSVTKKMVLMK